MGGYIRYMSRDHLLSQRIIALLRDRGEALQSSQIVDAFPEYNRIHNFRHVDGAIQYLRKRGEIKLLPRVKGERPYPLWDLPGRFIDTKAVTTPESVKCQGCSGWILNPAEDLCVLEAMVGVLINRGEINVDQARKFLSRCDIDSVWAVVIGPAIDALSDYVRTEEYLAKSILGV